MKKFNKSKVIIPALAMIALTTAASATGTVAWFAANTAVSVSGMKMTATAGSNLLIATDTIGSTAKANESDFGASLSQDVKGDIKPVSTVNGTAFFYTSDALASGDAADSAVFSTLNTTVGNASYNVIDTSYKGFLEYVFQLKAINTATKAQNIDLTGLNLTYTPTSEAEETSAKAIHAYRAAFFVQDITTATPTAGVGTKTAIYAQTGNSHFTSGEAVSAATGTTGAVTYASTATALASVDASSTKYYKVVVRAYLEGEDKSCNNAAFLGITAGWSLGLNIALQDTTTPATAPVTGIVTTVNAYSGS